VSATSQQHHNGDGSAASTARAERVVDEAGRALSGVEHAAEDWAERAGRWVAGALARAREEAEDIWAEARAKRREW
jgi:hypothetical protein